MQESQQAQSVPAQGVEASAAVQQRQSWRPIAVQQAESLAAGITDRAERMGYRSEQFSSWYEEFTHRLQPWGGWSPLAMDLRQEEPLAEAESGRNSGEGQRSQVIPVTHITPEMPLAQADKLRERITTPTLPSTPEASSLPSNVREATSLPPVSTPSRSPLQLAILRSPAPSPHPPRRSGQETWPGLPLIPASVVQVGVEESPFPRSNSTTASTPALPLLRTRLSLSVSLIPRQEIRGGFPQSSELLGTPGAARLSSTPGTQGTTALYLPLEPGSGPSSLPVRQARVLSQESLKVEDRERSHSTNLPSPVDSYRPPSQAAPSVIEQLIEQATVPVNLPRLELRLVSPESVRAHPPEPPDRPKEEPSPSPAPPALSPAQPTPPLPLPPPLDINAVTDQVYQKLQHRQRFERERRGWY